MKNKREYSGRPARCKCVPRSNICRNSQASGKKQCNGCRFRNKKA